MGFLSLIGYLDKSANKSAKGKVDNVEGAEDQTLKSRTEEPDAAKMNDDMSELE
jgi:hypothetical protein